MIRSCGSTSTICRPTRHFCTAWCATWRRSWSSRDSEIERLQLIIKQLQRARFGRRSERLDPDQLALGLEDLDADIARVDGSRAPAARRARDCEATAQAPARSPAARRARHRSSARDDCPAAAARFTRSVRASARCSTGCRPSSACMRIRRPKYGCRHLRNDRTRPRRRSDRSPGGLATPGADRPGPGRQVLRPRCRFIARRRSSPGTASDRAFDAGRTGSAAPAGGSKPLHERLCRARVRLRPSVRRRHADPGARSRSRADQDRAAVGLCP